MLGKIILSARIGGTMKKVSILAIGLFSMTMLLPQTSHALAILFGPSLFSPRTNYTDFYQDSNILFVYPGSPDRYFSAPVFLPHGARVTNVVLFCKDNSSEMLQFEMKRLNVYTNMEELMFSFSTRGKSISWRRAIISDIAHSQINNGSYLYHLSVWFSGGHGRSLALRAIKVRYEMDITIGN
jgi:hypothetical protein